MSSLTRISPSLYRVDDICNVYLIQRGERALLIDAGSGLVREHLAELGIAQVDWVLQTHFHRDQCAGAPALVADGARLAVPAGEAAYFAGARNFWRNRQVMDNYNTYNDFFAPTRDVRVDRELRDYETFRWLDVELKVIPTPGHTRGSISLVGVVDGQSVAFTGDLFLSAGRLWTLYDLEWAYGNQTGVHPLALSLRTLDALGASLALPSHGEPVATPRAAIAALLGRLRQYWQWVDRARRPSMDFVPLVTDYQIEPLTPHLWVNAYSVANTYVILDAEGKGLFLDYGFPSSSHFSANWRFAEHSLSDLRRVAGLKTVDAVLPSHYHDDHVCGLQYLQAQHGAKLWIFENMADIAANPQAYKIPCLWPQPFSVHRTFGEGEQFSWQDVRFSATKLPGHTEYHCGLFFELDGRRLALVGDTFARTLAGPRFGGPVYQNLFHADDFARSVEKVRAFEPEFILTGHFGAQQVDRAFLDDALYRARELEGCIRALVPVPEEAGFALDPNWATIYPYHATVRPGDSLALQVRLRNYLSRPTSAAVEIQSPAGYLAEPSHLELSLPAEGEGAAGFTLRIPADAAPVARQVLLADVRLGERRFGPVAEGLVSVE